jgi:hypothetical protein
MAELGLDWSPFKRGMAAANVYADNQAKQIGGALVSRIGGALSGTALLFGTEQAIKKTFDRARELKSESKLFDLGTDDIQLLDKAAHRVGLSFEEIGMSIGKFRNARKEAAEGNKDLRKSFESIGYSIDAVRGTMQDGAMYLEILKNATRFTGQAQQGALLDIFGSRSAYKILAVAREMQNTKLSPFSLKEDDVEKLERFRIALERLSKTGKGMIGFLIADHVDAYADLLEGKLRRGYLKMLAASPLAFGPLATIGAINQLDALTFEDAANGGAAGAAAGALDLNSDYRDKEAEKEAKELKEAKHELLKAQDALARHKAPDSERVKLLQNKIAELDKEAWLMEGSSDHDVQMKAVKRREEQIALKGELESFRQSKGEQLLGAYRSAVGALRPNDALVGYGNFLGSDPNHDLQVTLTDCKYILDQIEANTKLAKEVGNKLFPDAP